MEYSQVQNPPAVCHYKNHSPASNNLNIFLVLNYSKMLRYLHMEIFSFHFLVLSSNKANTGINWNYISEARKHKW